jgi:hypothetical protein
MKNAIEWIKSNPVVTAAGFVSLIGLVVIVYFYFIAAPAYSAEKSEMLKEKKQTQDRLTNIPVPLPNEDPNSPPDTYRVVVNQKVISDVDSIYRTIQSQYDDILINAEQKNSENHVPFLLGGGNIWPDASPTQFFDLYVRAASDYKDHFKAVFDAQNPNNWNMPRMIASSPPTQAELELLLARSAFDYISSVGAQSVNDLSQNQANQLFAEQRMKLMEALNRRARNIHIYASLPPEEDPYAPEEPAAGEDGTPAPAIGGFGEFGGAPGVGGVSSQQGESDYPFRIQSWAFADQPPTPDQLWEGQNQLWILRDIMGTIHKFNRVGKQVKAIGPDGSIQDEWASVVNSPIKRLLKLETVPGYVGLHTTGAATGGEEEGEFGFDAVASPGFIEPLPATPGVTGQPGTETPSIYPTPPTALAPKEATENAPEHFGITPTGRVSNSVFDVRHTLLTIDIEAARLPAFMEALQQTNFMTVIKAKVTNLDEYELLREGYVYGYEDVVRAELVIESLWFRNWTEELMPKIVKEKLLIILPEADQFGTGQDPFGP